MALLRGRAVNNSSWYLLKVKTYSKNVACIILFNLVERSENKIMELGK